MNVFPLTSSDSNSNPLLNAMTNQISMDQILVSQQRHWLSSRNIFGGGFIIKQISIVMVIFLIIFRHIFGAQKSLRGETASGRGTPYPCG